MMSFVISEPISAHSSHRKWGFSVMFLFLDQLSSNLAQGFKIGCWFLFSAQKVVLETISANMTQKPLFYAHFWCFLVKRLLEIVFFGQMPLRNSVVMATPKAPGDQKLFERVNCMLKLKVTKFQVCTPNGFWAILKKPAGKFAPPVQNRVNKLLERGTFKSK